MAAVSGDLEFKINNSMLPLENDIHRPESANYHSSVWRDYFVRQQFPPSNFQKSEEWIKGRVGELVTQVKLLMKNCDDRLQEMELVDALQRLGLFYHFEKEIDEALSRIHNDQTGADDLHFAALRFRLLRQHGYHVSSDIFGKFKDAEGNFKAVLSEDVRGLLSLYEASYLSIPGESILDDATEFARKHLQSKESCNLKPILATQISQALRSPLRRRIERLEARLYIDIYQEDEDIRNDVELELAKLDFHLLQILHREEVKIISKWWIESGLAEKLIFARDRVVECYFWILGVYFEPHFSRARIMMTKVIIHFSLIDDIYDVYGTLEELRVHTESLQRWDLAGVDQMNECLKLQYLHFYDTVKDFENELAADQVSYRVRYFKEAIKSTAKAWFKEAEWRDAKYVPPLEEYLSVALPSTTYPTLVCTSFLGMGDVATKQAFEWILSYPKVLEAATILCRLMDDVVSNELEQKREHVASSIQCYMKEHDVSPIQACQKLREMNENAWKELNQGCLDENGISTHLVMRVVNLARALETVYKDYDSYTHSDATMKDNITLLLVQPIFS